MAILNICGFETGFESSTADIAGECGMAGAGGLGGTVPTIVTSPVRTGTYAARANATTTGTSWFRLGTHAAAGGKALFNAATTWARFYFRYATKPGSGSEEIAVMLNTSQAVKATIRLDSAGKLSAFLQDGTTQVGSTGSTVLVVDTWYCIEFKVGTSATVGIVEVRLAPDDGSTPAVEITGTGNTTATNGGGFLGGKLTNRSSQTVDFFYDDIQIDDAEYPGQGAVLALLSTGDGSYTGWTGGSGTTEAEIDDIPHHDIDTTYIQVPATGDNTARTFAMQDTATVGISGTIHCVKPVAVVRSESTASSSSVGVRLRSGSTDSNTSGVEWATTYALHAKLIPLDPNGGGAWTTSGVDGIEAGVFAGTIAQAQRCTAIAVMVSYTPAVSAPPLEAWVQPSFPPVIHKGRIQSY